MYIGAPVLIASAVQSLGLQSIADINGPVLMNKVAVK